MMKEKTAMMQDGELLKQCRRIFGADIVVSAWVTTDDYGSSSQKEILGRLRGSRFTDDGTDTLNYDAETIVIQFANGRKVMFHNSEWASISRCDESLIYQV